MLALLSACLLAQTGADALLDIKSVEIVWQGPLDDYGALGPAFSKTDEDVTLGLLVQFPDGSCAVAGGAWQDANGQDHLCDRTLDELGDCRVDWYRVVPGALSLERDARGSGTLVPWVNEPWARTRVDRTVVAEALSCPNAQDALTTCGTVHVAARLVAATGETLGATPDAVEPGKAFALHVRTGDSAAGVVWELANVPAGRSPRGAPPSMHDTPLGLVVDGPSMVIQVARRMGVMLPFTGEEAVRKAAVQVKGPVREGDVVMVRGSVLMLVEDAGKRGVLDAPDQLASVEGAPLHLVHALDMTGVGAQVLRLEQLPPRLAARRPRVTSRKKVVDLHQDAGVR